MENQVFHENSKFRKVEGCNVVAFYNPRHDVNRFFAKGDEENDNDDSLDLDDDLNVFKNEGTDTDLIEANKDKILYYVDLENEEIVDAEKRNADREEGADLEEEVDSSVHPVLVNQFPLAKEHNILLLFAEEGLPQILSDEILDLLFQIFRLFPEQQLRVGYNSMGAECWINNLHFHLLNNNAFSEVEDVEKFPIEDCALTKILDSTLQHKSADEINMYSIGVEFYLTEEWPVKAFVVKPLKKEEDELKEENENALAEASDPTASVAHAVGVILNILIDNNIPHNLLISDKGETVYILPRKFDLLINAANFSTEFNDLCGLVKCKDEKTFENLTESQYQKFLKKEVALDNEAFTKIREELVEKFIKEYECNEY